MKGLAILLVVLGHLFMPYTQESHLHPWNTIIYSFHMSFFFFLSGYINEKVNGIERIGTFNFIKKKFNSLIIPFLFWSFITPIFLYNHIPATWNDFIEPFCIFPNKHYWFLPVLFFFMTLYPIKHRFEKKGIKYDLYFSMTSIGIFLVGGGITYQYHLIGYGIYWASFLLGDYLSKYESFRNEMMKNNVYGLSAVILCLAWKFYPIYPTETIWQSMSNLLLSFTCSFTASIVLYNLFRKAVIPAYIKKYLSEMGKFSLVIYVVPISLLPKSFIFPNALPDMIINLSILSLGILHTILSYIFGRIVFEIPYLRYIMFGKK